MAAISAMALANSFASLNDLLLFQLPATNIFRWFAQGQAPLVGSGRKVEPTSHACTFPRQEMAKTPSIRPSLTTLEDVLREHWGFSSFRPSQIPVVKAASEGRDTLAILPTGGGKSVCYQVPGLVKGGVCLVVSPLVALMADQVQGLTQRGIPASALTSGMHRSDVARVLDNCRFGPGGFLFIAPERLSNPEFEMACRAMDVRMIVVDEAHCASQWGHTFRADYLEIGQVREWHPKASWLALTATATEQVADDIERLLGMRECVRIRAGMRRSNLAFAVHEVRDRHAAIIDWAHRLEGSAILYVRTRRDAESMASMLDAHGHSAAPYHAGMPRSMRDAHQRDWDAGRLRILACTTAFGMGIDKPDVRHVAHAHVPDSPEAYIQEAGRAGRDGRPAWAEMFLDGNAVSETAQHISRQWPDQQEVRLVLQALANHLGVAVGTVMEEDHEVMLTTLARRAKVPLSTVRKSMDLMCRAGWLRMSQAGLQTKALWTASPGDACFEAAKQGVDSTFLHVLAARHDIRKRTMWPLDGQVLFEAAGCDARAGWQHLARLRELGVLDWAHPQDRTLVRFHVGRPDASTARLPRRILEDQVESAGIRWERMREYVETTQCRAATLEQWFDAGEEAECGICDRCAPPPAPTEEALLDWMKDGVTVAELRRLVPPTHQASVRELLERWRAEGRLSWAEGVVKAKP